ncbi:CL17A protein, partial [Alectura lathami]|nr:CL17A protein [Alectura lathami]
MALSEGRDGSYELAKDMLLEDQTQRKAPKRAALSLLASSTKRAAVLLPALLALGFVLLLALTLANIRRVSAVWEALERARLQGEKSHAAAWHNLSEARHALDAQLSGELEAIHKRLLNVSREVEEVQRRTAQCRAECGRELSDRVRALEQRESLEPALQQLAELGREQSRVSALLSAALEETRNLTEMFCTSCPAGWLQFARTCYFFSTDGKPWMEARAACAALGGQLAVVDSEQENKFLGNQIMETRVFWLGLSDMDKEGEWQWLDGRSLSLAFWRSGEPNNVGQHGEDCGTVTSSGLWNDAECSVTEAWICERRC